MGKASESTRGAPATPRGMFLPYPSPHQSFRCRVNSARTGYNSPGLIFANASSAIPCNWLGRRPFVLAISHKRKFASREIRPESLTRTAESGPCCPPLSPKRSKSWQPSAVCGWVGVIVSPSAALWAFLSTFGPGIQEPIAYCARVSPRVPRAVREASCRPCFISWLSGTLGSVDPEGTSCRRSGSRRTNCRCWCGGRIRSART